MALSWRALEDAVRAWAMTALNSAVPVIFSRQNGPQPARPYITIGIEGGMVRAGPFDEEIDVTNLSNSPGEEIEQNIIGWREFSVSVQVFSDATTGGGEAYDYASQLLTALMLPSVTDILYSAGLVFVDAGAIQDLSAVLETKWQNRAQLSVRFRIVDTAQEKTGYIATCVPEGVWT